jgi:hypothetical protein
MSWVRELVAPLQGRSPDQPLSGLLASDQEKIMRRSFPQLILGALAAPILFFANSASAAPSADACGNIDLVATGDCHLVATGGCEAKCVPLQVRAACDGQCDASIDVSCAGSCNASCVADCEVQPAQFDCNVSCEADCGASCDGSCSAESDKASCTGYCKESCRGNCDARCGVKPPTADCKGKCQMCCEGSCTAKANFSCSYDCSADIQGGCVADCKVPGGALFCTDERGVDQYVHVGDFDDCIAYLQSQFSIKIDITAHAEGSATCDANGCEGVGSAGIGCSTQPVGSAPLDVGAIATMAVGLGFVASRRRRR